MGKASQSGRLLAPDRIAFQRVGHWTLARSPYASTLLRNVAGGVDDSQEQGHSMPLDSDNTLVRSQPCPECGAMMLWTQSVWPHGSTGMKGAAYRCLNGPPARSRHDSAVPALRCSRHEDDRARDCRAVVLDLQSMRRSLHDSTAMTSRTCTPPCSGSPAETPSGGSYAVIPTSGVHGRHRSGRHGGTCRGSWTGRRTKRAGRGGARSPS
jgi:hypothetical protein